MLAPTPWLLAVVALLVTAPQERAPLPEPEVEAPAAPEERPPLPEPEPADRPPLPEPDSSQRPPLPEPESSDRPPLPDPDPDPGDANLEPEPPFDPLTDDREVNSDPDDADLEPAPPFDPLTDDREVDGEEYDDEEYPYDDEYDDDEYDGDRGFQWDVRFAWGGAVKLKRSNRAGHAVDAAVGFRVHFDGIGLIPELGYSMFADGQTTDHYGLLSVGVGLTGEYYALGILPGFVVGSIEGGKGRRDTGAGFRATVIAEITTFVGAQMSYQVFGFEGGVAHEFRWTISLNRFPLLFVGILIGEM